MIQTIKLEHGFGSERWNLKFLASIELSDQINLDIKHFDFDFYGCLKT